jgi:hypothetical protein
LAQSISIERFAFDSGDTQAEQEGCEAVDLAEKDHRWQSFSATPGAQVEGDKPAERPADHRLDRIDYAAERQSSSSVTLWALAVDDRLAEQGAAFSSAPRPPSLLEQPLASPAVDRPAVQQPVCRSAQTQHFLIARLRDWIDALIQLAA